MHPLPDYRLEADVELTGPPLVIAVVLIIATLLTVLLGWAFLGSLLFVLGRIMLSLVRYIWDWFTYMFDTRHCGDSTKRRTPSRNLESRAPPVRRDPVVQERVDRIMAQRRRRNRIMFVPMVLGATLAIAAIVFYMFQFVAPFFTN